MNVSVDRTANNPRAYTPGSPTTHRRHQITRRACSLILVCNHSEKQKLRFKSATHAVPPTFSGLSNQIAKEQNDRITIDTIPAITWK
jgi:hypothetical protein